MIEQQKQEKVRTSLVFVFILSPFAFQVAMVIFKFFHRLSRSLLFFSRKTRGEALFMLGFFFGGKTGLQPNFLLKM
jgi:hypothetical protein